VFHCILNKILARKQSKQIIPGADGNENLDSGSPPTP